MTSTSIYTPISPTYLYIKQHSITKKKYFGKTTLDDPIKYLGSGVYWNRHIKKHGKQFVETIWVSDLYTDTSITEVALHFSCENNIAESNAWANLEPENGLNGGVPGRTHSAESKAKISASKTGKKRRPQSVEHIAKRAASNTGRTHSAESIAKISASKTGSTHSAETKAKMSASSKGKTHSAESKAKMSASRTGKKRGPYILKTRLTAI